MKKIVLFFCLPLLGLSFYSCTGCDGSSHSGYVIMNAPSFISSSDSSNTTVLDTISSINVEGTSSTYQTDENVSKSIDREQALRDAGMDGAANIERNARRKYEQGGGYTSTDGSRQIHYNGSREQENDLRMIDEYFGF